MRHPYWAGQGKELEPDQHLASVGAVQQVHECLRGVLQPVHDRLLIAYGAVGQSACHLFRELRGVLPLAAHQEAAKSELLPDGQCQVMWGGRWLGGIVLGYGAANGHPSPEVQHGKGGLKVSSAHVVEVDVDTVTAGCLFKLVPHGAVVVVEGGIEANTASPALNSATGSSPA